MTLPDLLPHHAKLIADSAIADDVAEARGYRSVTTKAELDRLGFGRSQQLPPGLILPVWNVAGETVLYQLRPDRPRIKDGKPLKYETPFGARMALDVPPAVLPVLGDPTVPLGITEGIRKADAAVSAGLSCVDILGVWNWRGRNADGGLTALADWELVAFNGRIIYLIFDSDAMTKRQVHDALRRFRQWLRSKKAEVRVVYLPHGAGGAKQGLDDFLAAGHIAADVLLLAEDDLRPAPAPEGDGGGDAPYGIVDGRMCARKQEQGQTFWQPLSNFSARIVEQVVADDGDAERGELVVAGALADGTPLPDARVPLDRFAGMGWVIPRWGIRAAVRAGSGNADRLREALQLLSPDAPRRREFTCPGWRHIDEEGWIYVHTGGAIGACGAVPDVAVALDRAAERLALPDPPTGAALAAAVRASLGLLDLAPDRIMAAVLGAAHRAPLNVGVEADAALLLVGPTGVFKSELAALLMQHFGAGFDRLHLPGSWSSTPNHLEHVAFVLKDAPAVLDDFAPTGSPHDIQRYHAAADRMLRGVGNHAGRGRLNADLSARPDRRPRALVVITGEDVPRGHSARARAVIVEVGPGDVDRERLTSAQAAARAGTFAQATAGYLRWLAPRLDELRAQLPGEVTKWRDVLTAGGMHARTPEAVAHLAAAWRLWLRFAVEDGGLGRAEAEAAWRRIFEALRAVATGQGEHHRDEDPARRFLALLGGALQSGSAHVSGADGLPPLHPTAWGWRLKHVGTGAFEREEWQAQGAWVGWLDGEDLYLEPEAAYAAAQRLGTANGTPMSVQPKTLHKRLDGAGLLASTEKAAGRGLTVRRAYGGERRQYLHLSRGVLAPDEATRANEESPDDAPDDDIPGPVGPVGPVLAAWNGVGNGGAGERPRDNGIDRSDGAAAGGRIPERDKGKDVISPPVPNESRNHVTTDDDTEGWDHWEEPL